MNISKGILLNAKLPQSGNLRGKLVQFLTIKNVEGFWVNDAAPKDLADMVLKSKTALVIECLLE